MMTGSSLARILLGLTVFFFAANGFGQQADTAIVVGLVLDPSGAAVTTAAITLTHKATNLATEVHTNARGEYRTNPLRVGEYSISVQAPGFRRFTQDGLALNVGDVRQVDASLQVGVVSETQTVRAEASLLDTESSIVGTVINNKQVENLPLNGRDYTQLAALSAGTVPAVNGGVGISVGGQPGVQVAFLLDGQDNNNQQLNTGHSGQKDVVKPSVDAIQEFKVITNGASAEYGRSSSGVISVVLKSGSNKVHGTAFEFFRNAALDAENYFTPSGAQKPPFGQNQYGATIGGPILHDRTFFFGDFEIGRVRQSQTTVSTLPTVNQKAGLFSTSITDPATGLPFSQDAGGEYVIPNNRFDTFSSTMLGYYPAPQISGPVNNYTYASPLYADPRRWDFRIDQTLSASHTLYFRFGSQTFQEGAVTPLPPDAHGNYYAAGTTAQGEVGAQKTDSTSFVLVDNYVWSPSLISSIRAGWNSLFWNNYFPQQSLTNIGIPGITANYPGFSDINISGYQDLGITNVPNQDGTQDRQLSGDLTKQKGAHTLKFGAQLNWLQSYFNSSQASSGTFSFDGRYTGNAFADFLLGDVSQVALSNNVLVKQRTPLKHFFIQDDWRATRALTLNLGLRFELSPPAVDRQRDISNLNMDSTPGRPFLQVAGPPGSGRRSESLLGVDNHQLAPRVGFAYALPDKKTVVRASYGVFYSYQVPLRPENNPSNHLVVTETTDPTAPPTIFLRHGVAASALSVANATNVTLTSLDTRSTAPFDQQWNLNIQRQLPGGVLLEAGYYGNKIIHSWRSFNGNQLALPTAGPLPANIPYKYAAVPGTPYTISLATTISRSQMDGYSRYNALQVKAERRYSKALTFIASYAYSKDIGFGDSSGVQDILNLDSERAVSVQDMKHHFTGSAVYELPFGRGEEFGSDWNRSVNAVLGGWSISPIVTVDSGFPLNLTVSKNPSNVGGTDRPNIVGNWHLQNPSVHEWFNVNAFTKNAPLTYGNAGRNILRGPGLFNLDLAVHKSFRVTERVTAQLRLESFNLTNTPALGGPATKVGAVGFGVISSAGSPRDNQIGVKVSF